MAAFFTTLILLGALQGFIVSGMLFFTKQNKIPNRILAVLLLLIAMACFNLYGNYTNYWFGSPILRFISNVVPLVVVMPLGPLIYFYVRSSLSPEFKVNKKQRRHFYTVVIDLVPSFTAIIFILGVFAGLLKNTPLPWSQFIDDYQVYADIPRWLSVTCYVWLSYKYLNAYRTSHPAGLNEQAAHFRWLQQFVRAFIIFQTIWLLYLIPYVIPAYNGWMLDTFDWYPIYIPMTILIYWLGIKGYAVQTRDKRRIVSAANVLPEEVIFHTKAAIRKAMEEDKLFLNPELNLSVLSQHISIPQKTISTVLNQHMQTSFSAFVNGYRVLRFKEKICQSGAEQLTIVGVAAECGFSSQATFQRIFKEMEGLSPSTYLKTSMKTT
jgi:AraC-like DNA-binding protein